jgi:hypothetical protein
MTDRIVSAAELADRDPRTDKSHLPWPTEHPADPWPYDPAHSGPVRHKILRDLWPLAVPVEELTQLPGNPRKGDVPRMRTSLRTFGQRKNVVVNVETGLPVIEAGNHTQLAAIAEGWTHLSIVRVRDDPATETGYALADNRLGELGSFDLRLLVDATRRLKAADPALLLSAGWTDDEHEYLEQAADRLAGVEVDPEGEWVGMPGYENEDQRNRMRVLVYFPTEEDAGRFFELIDRPMPKWPKGNLASSLRKDPKQLPVIWWPHPDRHREEHGEANQEAWQSGQYSSEAWQIPEGQS